MWIEKVLHRERTPPPQHKELRRAYGFDEVAIVPGDVTINPDQVNTFVSLGPLTLPVPILTASMDAVVDPAFAILFGKMGGLSIMNLEGVQTRYPDPGEVLAEIVAAPAQAVTSLLQKVYSAPIQEHLVGKRVEEMKKGGYPCGVAVTPQNAKTLAPLAVEGGADVLLVQSTVTTARHISKSYKGLAFSELCQQIKVPVLVGNCVSYSAALELMRSGIAGILVGVGPGAACTTREVLGVGVPQVTATLDCAAAREQYFQETGRYVNLITDGGMRNGGDICKALVCGADGVMLGSLLAQAQEAPGKGYHWGMATSHASLPRGTRVRVGTTGTLEQVLFGPTSRTDGTQNLVGALRTCMGVVGALTLRDMHKVEMVIAPAIKTEGKAYQLSAPSC